MTAKGKAYFSIKLKLSGNFSSINFEKSLKFISNASASFTNVVNCGSFKPLSTILTMEIEMSFSLANINDCDFHANLLQPLPMR